MASQVFEAKQQQATQALQKARLLQYTTHTPRHRDFYSFSSTWWLSWDFGTLFTVAGTDAYKQVQKEAQQLFEEAKLTEEQLVHRLEDYR